MNRLLMVVAAYCAANVAYLAASAVLLLKGRVLLAVTVLTVGWLLNLALSAVGACMMSRRNIACRCGIE